MRNKILRVIQILLIGVIVFCGYQIFDYFSQRGASDQSFKEVENIVDEMRNENGETSDQSAQAGERTYELPTFDPNFSYDMMMTRLHALNKDIVMYLDMKDVDTHYPIVQVGDNDYYLRRGLDEKYNVQGTIFMDHVNNSNLTDQNTVIYGHMMYTGYQMFGSLKHYLDQDFVSNGDHTFTLTKGDGVYTYKIFSTYHVDARADYRTPNMSEEEWVDFLNTSYDRSETNFGERPDFKTSDRVVTFSTCSEKQDESTRIAVLGLLIDSPADHVADGE